ncbi:MAG: hypothetical protein LW848_12970 [Hyphomonadaceae bacterium]|jgi:hypothetical protein|nr:hypothetical protein [Hyphomonadaceae bacterium]
MTQVILTKYLGPTNTRGSRIKVTTFSGSIIVNWDHQFSQAENHTLAAHALIKKRGWDNLRFHGGLLPDDTGYAFVCIGKDA